MKYIKLFENFSFREYIEEITTLCLVELEDDGYQVSVIPRMAFYVTTIENKCIVSIAHDQLTNLTDIEDYLLTYIDFYNYGGGSIKLTVLIIYG
jgi:hypothetical protein